MPVLSHLNYTLLNALPTSLGHLKNPPQNLYYTGRLELLNAPFKVALVGTRKPSVYTQQLTAKLAKGIVQMGGVVVSGGALGVDIIAQKNALPHTIMISPCSLDLIYPPSNSLTIMDIAKEGLLISEYKEKFQPYRFSFLERNRLVVALSDLVIIPEASHNSGSMASAHLTLAQKKPLFVLPQRLYESEGTLFLLAQNNAQAIYDIDAFLDQLAQKFNTKPPAEKAQNAFLKFCQSAPSFEEAYAEFGDFLLEQELLGVIKRENGRVVLL
ncbi:DNA-processing protein DprA [Helicobacter suis]|uniref:DNA-processing protein DprA n=1 Tax=Helicobacter suis TaxID=104628 RepID=UPI0013D4C62E